MFSFDPNPTTARKAWSSSTCLLYGTLYLTEGGEGSVYGTLVLSWLNYCCIMHILPVLRIGRDRSCWETVHVQCIHNFMYRVTLYNFSCNGNGCKDYPRPFNRGVLHRPLCKDTDKSPEGRTSTYNSPSLTAMSMSPETQNMKLKRNMVYFTQEEMYVNPLGIRRLALTPALVNYKIY